MLVRYDRHRSTFVHASDNWAGQWAIFDTTTARNHLTEVLKDMKTEEEKKMMVENDAIIQKIGTTYRKQKHIQAQVKQTVAK